MDRAAYRAAALLFGSGFCALLYQVAWLRELRLTFGASTAASAAVLAVFMGGLGTGSLLLSRRAEHSRRPLGLYAGLELGIAVAAAASPFLLYCARHLYWWLGGTQALGPIGGTCVRLCLSALVLGVPTFLMGGTLPAMARAVETAGDVGRRRLALLYGANTLGAVGGALLATFALVEILGVRKMIVCACAVNALVAIAARQLSRAAPEAPAEPARDDAVEAGAPARLVLAAAAAVGFAFLLMELVWYRMLGPLLGGTTFTFGLILAAALAGIGLGGIAYAFLFRDRSPTLAGFAVSCGAEALFIALPYALGDRLAILAAFLRHLGWLGFGAQVASWSVVVAIVVVPAAIVAGLQFPLLIALYGRGERHVARQTGLAYAWNTVGAIAGSLAGGFGLLPLLSATGAWRAVAIFLAALGAVALAVALRTRRSSRALGLGAGSLALAAFALSFAVGPTAVWRHGAIGTGAGPPIAGPNPIHAWENAERRSIVWQAEGVESSVALDSEIGYAFVVNGKTDGNARMDAPTQVMGGLLGALLAERVRRAMVIGLGTGSTAGWLGAVPAIERVDVAELEPAILHVAEACAPINQRVLDNPKVHVTLGDARELLLTSRASYDLVFSEPSSPYRAGIASLFTQEFYRAVRARLQPGGLFLQWLQAWSIDAQTVRTVVATLNSVFPEVDVWVTQEADLILVASASPLGYDLARLRARLAEEPFRSAAAQAWGVNDVEGLFAHFGASSLLAGAIARAEGDDLSTDDQTLVEFGFARGVARGGGTFRSEDLRRAARAHRADRPIRVEGGALDWAKVEDRRLSMLAAQEAAPTQLPVSSPAAAERALAEAAWIAGDLRGALAHWRAQPRTPEDPIEEALQAEALAEAADPEAERAIERVRLVSAVAADALVARLELRRGQIARAAVELERSFVGYRTDPWPLPALMHRALPLANEIAAHDRALGERLFHALAVPFAVSLLDRARQNTRIELALRIDFARLCREALQPFEPHPDWQRDFLAGRVRCYELSNDPRLARARRDQQRFAENEPPELDRGLDSP